MLSSFHHRPPMAVQVRDSKNNPRISHLLPLSLYLSLSPPSTPSKPRLQPRHCDLPKFDPLRFLKSFRDTNVGGQPTVMVVCWSILGIKRVTEWMLILQKEHGHKLLVSMISSSLIVDTEWAGFQVPICPLLEWNGGKSDLDSPSSFLLPLSKHVLMELEIRQAKAVKVAALAPNVPAMHELNFAVLMAGAVLCTLNICHDSAMLSILLRHSEAKVIFVHYKLLEIAHGTLDLLPSTETRPLRHKAEVMTRSSPPPQIFLNMEEMGFGVSQMYGLTETYGPRILAA